MVRTITIFLLSCLSLFSQQNFESAKEIEASKDFLFKIEKKSGSQFFKISVTAAGYLRFTSQDTKVPNLEPRAALYNEEKKLLGEREIRVEKGNYYIQIYDQWNDQFSPQEFSGKIDFFPEMDPSEPDSAEKSRTLKAGDKFTYAIMPVKDIDYYQFTATENGYIKLALAASGVNNLDPNGQILNSNNQVLGNLEARVEKSKTYLIQIYDQWSDQSAPKALSGEIIFYPETDIFESNDSIELAKAVEINKPFKINLMPLKDRDFFKIEVPAAGMVTIAISQPQVVKNLAPAIIFYDVNKISISNNNFLQTIGPATVYFEIYDRWGANSSLESLEVNVKFLEEIDLNEPNNQPFMASEIGKGELLQGAIAPPGDIDFYEISVDNPGYLLLNPLSVPKDLHLYFQLCDTEGKPLINEAGMNFKVKPGKYLLKTSASYNSFSTEHYSIQPYLIEEIDELERDEQNFAEVKADKFYNSAVLPKNDVDYWKISLKKPSLLSLQYLGVPAGFIHYIEVMNEKGEVIINSTNPPVFLPAGDFKIKAWSNIETPQGFKMAFRTKESLDKYEFNNSFDTAVNFNFEKQYQIYLESKSDTDCFKFTLTKKETVSFFANDQDIQLTRNLQLFVYDKQQKLAKALINSNGKWQGELEAGDYYLVVTTDLPRDVAVLLNGYIGPVTPKNDALAVALVGLKLNDKEKELTAKIAESTGSLQINTDDSTDISQAVEKAVVNVVKSTPEKKENTAKETPGKKTPPALLISLPFILLLGLLPIIIIIAIRRKKSNENQS